MTILSLFFGNKESWQNPDDRRLILTNQIAFILALAASPYFLIFHAVGLPLQSIVVIPIVLTLLACICLNIKIKRHTEFAKWGVILTVDLGLLFYATSLGPRAGIQLVFFALISIPLVLFNPKEKAHIIAAFLLPIFTFYYLEISHYTLFPRVNLADPYARWIYYTMIFVTFAIIVATIRFYFVLNDRAEANLQTAYTDLKASRQAQVEMAEKVGFATALQAAGHEIKNPMFLIEVQLETVMAEPEKYVNDASWLARILGVARRLRKIAITMVDHAQDLKPAEPAPFSVSELLAELYSVAKSAGARKGVRVVLEVPPDLIAVADADHVFQVVVNLLTNAVDYSPERGEVMILAGSGQFTDMEGRSQPGTWVGVTDHGPGLSDAQKANLFVSNISTSQAPGNAGLGLQLAYRIAQINHGKIEVDSELGKGATFRLWMPAGVAACVPETL